MTDFREKLLDRIIRIYGFEHPITQDFAKMLETWNEGEVWDNALETLVKAHEACPYTEDDE